MSYVIFRYLRHGQISNHALWGDGDVDSTLSGYWGDVTWYEHMYEVVGNTRFPIDMLRYDTSVPATAADASAITVAVRQRQGESKAIMLTCLTPDPHWRPAVDRWRALGWFVRNHHKKGRGVKRLSRW